MGTRPGEIQTPVRWTVELKEKAAALAKRHDRSLNAEILFLVKQAIEEEEKRTGTTLR
jgi:hypothetical protein